MLCMPLEFLERYDAGVKGKLDRLLSSKYSICIMYLPALALLAIFILIPFFRGINISFTDWDGYSQNYRYVGFKQFANIFTDSRVLRTIRNTFIYGLGSALLQNILGFLFAMLFTSNAGVSRFMRTLVYMPVIVSGLIMGYIWKFFFQYSGGAVNDIMLLFGGEPVDWLAKGLGTVIIITVVNTFQFLGVSMVIYIAGLKGIPPEYYEVAQIDGANWWTRLRYITLPLIMPSINASVVMNVIGGLKLFDVIMALTKGGPGYDTMSLSTMTYTLYFARSDAGYSAALGIFMVIIIAIISLSMLVFFRKREVEL